MDLKRAIVPDFWRRYLESDVDFMKPLTDYQRNLVTGGAVAMHPHNACPVCHPKDNPETIDTELEVLVSCMRTSAQDTLINLHKAGYHIVKA